MPGNLTPQKMNSSMEDLMRNEENEYPVPDPNRTMINITNDLSKAHKKSLKEEIMDEITEKLMEKLQDMVNPESIRCTQEISRHHK
jgi:hypothetical protein